MTQEQKKDATHAIACLIAEYYDKKAILGMYPKFAEIYDEVCSDALAEAMAIIRAQDTNCR